MLQLDNINDPSVRGERKNAVNSIQHLLDEVNDVKGKVKSLKDSVIKYFIFFSETDMTDVSTSKGKRKKSKKKLKKRSES